MLAMKFDLHLHTTRSRDSIIELDELIRVAKERGLRGVAITDHNEFFRGGERGEVLLIGGSEVRVEGVDILCLFIDRIPKGDTVEELCEWVRDEGGISVFAHPYGRMRSLLLKERIAEAVDAIEVFNSRVPFSWMNSKAAILAKRFEKGITAGSDAHTPDEIGRAYVSYDESERLEDLKEAILRRSVEVRGTRSPLTVHISSTMHKFFKGRGPLEDLLREAIQ